MLTVTDAASQFLSQLLDQQELPEEVAVRFVQEEQGIALRQDQQRPGDETFEHEGRTVLLLDEQVATLLSDAKLDLEGDSLKLEPAGGEE